MCHYWFSLRGILDGKERFVTIGFFQRNDLPWGSFYTDLQSTGYMSRLRKILLLGAVAVAVGVAAQAPGQTNVYFVAPYSGGTSYRQLCSFELPFPPYHYKFTQRSRYEDADGLVIIDVGHEKERGGVLRRYLDVECGTESFTLPLDRPQPLRQTVR